MEKQIVTMADIALEAQVSKMSVSRVLNGHHGVSKKMRDRVLEAAQQLGYVPTFQAQFGASTCIAMVIPTLNTSYMGEILQGVSNAAERLDCSLMLYAQGTGDHALRSTYYTSLLGNTLIDGVLLVVPLDYEIVVNDMKAHDLTYVIIDHHNGTANEPSVTATNRKGVQEAMRHLMALGHRRIGFITGRMDIACSHERLQGYREGLVEGYLPFDPELVREGDFFQPSGFQQAHALLGLSDPPTAIIAANDVMAFGVMEAAKAHSLNLGSDISVIGFDDIFMASQTYPRLTTIRQPMAQMGEVALDMLVTLLQRRTVLNLRRELPTELVIRESTGPVRRK